MYNVCIFNLAIDEFDFVSRCDPSYVYPLRLFHLFILRFSTVNIKIKQRAKLFDKNSKLRLVALTMP